MLQRLRIFAITLIGEWRRRKTRESFTDYTRETTANCVASIGE